MKKSLILAFFLFLPALSAASQTEQTVQAEVPVLLYHHVWSGHRRFNVQPKKFEEQMLYLKERGYSFITFADLAGHLNDGTSLPKNPIVITFDDGWKNQYDNALPILRKYGAVATFFVMTGSVGKGRCMSWENLREMADEGMEIASHTKTHPFLDRIAPERARSELTGSKAAIERRLGLKVKTFAYPYGSGAGNPAIQKMVREAGYAAARGVRFGTVHRRSAIYNLRTVEVPDSLEGMKTLLKRKEGEK